MSLKLPIKLPKIKLDIFKNPKEAGKLAADAVSAADSLEASGPEKLEAVADLLNLAIDIPYVPEALEVVIFRSAAQLVYGVVRSMKGSGDTTEETL